MQILICMFFLATQNSAMSPHDSFAKGIRHTVSTSTLEIARRKNERYQLASISSSDGNASQTIDLEGKGPLDDFFAKYLASGPSEPAMYDNYGHSENIELQKEEILDRFFNQLRKKKN